MRVVKTLTASTKSCCGTTGVRACVGDDCFDDCFEGDVDVDDDDDDVDDDDDDDDVDDDDDDDDDDDVHVDVDVKSLQRPPGRRLADTMRGLRKYNPLLHHGISWHCLHWR
jgi:hypothetical protein